MLLSALTYGGLTAGVNLYSGLEREGDVEACVCQENDDLLREW